MQAIVGADARPASKRTGLEHLQVCSEPYPLHPLRPAISALCTLCTLCTHQPLCLGTLRAHRVAESLLLLNSGMRGKRPGPPTPRPSPRPPRLQYSPRPFAFACHTSLCTPPTASRVQPLDRAPLPLRSSLRLALQRVLRLNLQLPRIGGEEGHSEFPRARPHRPRRRLQ